jgi:hypothetical protein
MVKTKKMRLRTMKKHLLISLFLFAVNANATSRYNNVLHETNNIEFGLQSSVYSNNGILDYSPELARIGIELVHMGHRKFWSDPATQNGITYLSWIAPIGKSFTLISNIIRTGAKLITKQAVKIPVGRSGNILKVATKNTATTINGTKFTGHALDQMQARGILSPSAVLDVVKNSAMMFPGNRPGTMVFIKDNLKVITNKAGGIL